MGKFIDSIDRYYAKDRKAWRKWLEKNHNACPGIWLIYYKKDSGKTRVAYDEAVEEALCFGWIDSTVRPGDADYYTQLFTPRKAKSGWSKINKERVEKLMANGLMTPAGLEKINESKQNGHWEKLDNIEALVIPPELEKAFAKNKTARKFFDAQSKTNRKAMIYRVTNAKLPETKAKRIAEIMETASKQALPVPPVRKKLL